MAAESHAVPDALGKAPQLGHLVAAIAHHAAPGVVDPGTGQLRIDLEHVAVQQARHVGAAARTDGDAAAPQDAGIGQRAIIIECEAGVVDGGAGAYRRWQLVAQRFGHHHVGGNWQDGGAQCGIQFFDITAAADHDLGRVDHTGSGADAPTGAGLLDARHAAVLMHTHAETCQCPREAASIFKRMEVESARLEQAAEIALGRQTVSQFATAKALPFDAQRVLHEALLRIEHAVVVEPVREDDAFFTHIAINRVVSDAAANGLHRGQGHVIQFFAILRPNCIKYRALAQRKSAEHKTAIAARSAVANCLGFQQDDIGLAPLRQRERRGQACVAPTDDADGSVAAASERGVVGRGGGGAVVVGAYAGFSHAPGMGRR